MNPFGSQLTATFAIVYIVQWLKTSNSPLASWISQEKVAAAKVLSAIGAIATTAGIHVVWVSSTHSLNLGNLTPWTILLFCWHVGGQYLAQHAFYHLAVKPAAAVQPPAHS